MMLFASAFRMIELHFIAAASIGGFVGLTAAVLTVLTHLSGLKSFGIPYMLPLCFGRDGSERQVAGQYLAYAIRKNV